MRITSTSNPNVKQIRKLGSRKHRRRQGRYWAEGIRVTLTAFEAHAALEQVVVAPDLLAPEHLADVVERAGRADVPLLEVDADVFASLSGRDGPSGLGAVGRTPAPELAEFSGREGIGWLVLDEIQYPGNLGTILRTADAVGIGGVAVLGASTDPFDPTSIRASKGAVFSVPTVPADPDELLRWARRRGVHLVAVTPDAPRDVRDASLPTPVAMVLGNEQHGVRPELLGAAEGAVSLPMHGRADSLNLAVAAGVVLYELERQRR